MPPPIKPRGRLYTHEPSDSISPFIIRSVTNDIDVFHDDARSASGFKGMIYLGDLDGRAGLRVDLLVQIILGRPHRLQRSLSYGICCSLRKTDHLAQGMSMDSLFRYF